MRKARPTRELSATSRKLGPKPPAARRARRVAVEALMLDGKGIGRIVEALSETHDASATTLRKDAKAIRARWKREDTARADLRRARLLRRLERIADKAEAAADWSAATQALGLVAKLSGFALTGSASATVAIPAGPAIVKFETNLGDGSDHA